MIRNYLKIAFRTLARHKAFTGITVLGLALSMAVCLLILTFIWEQKSYDRFHENGDRIVRVLSDHVQPNGDVDALAATPAPLADVLTREVPGLEAAVRIGQIRSMAVYEGKAIYMTGLYVEPSFFEVFDFALESGDPQAILRQPNQLLLTHEAAEKLFGDLDPIGQPVRLEGQGDFVVAGLVEESPGKSHLQFDVLASFATLAASGRQEELTDWMNWWRFATYLLVESGETIDRLEAVLPEIAQRQYAGKEDQLIFHVQPLNDIALGPVLGNEIASYSVPAVLVYFLGALGLVIMLAAGFNYVSLSVARSIRRAREVGVRKVAGAKRSQVVLQFLSEAVVIALLSLVAAYALLSWLVPAFNSLTFVQMGDVSIDPSQLFAPELLALFAAFSVGVGVLAGLYPALRLSRFQPATVLKGLTTVRGFSGRLLRRSLTGIQFALALFFVVTTALIVLQVNFMLHADYGFTQENLLNVDVQGQSYDLLRAELLRHPDIVEVSATSKLPASGSTSRVELQREGMSEPTPAYEYAVDPTFLENLDLDVLAGRSFSSDIASDTAQAVILNETAVRVLGLGTPADAVGTFLQWGDDRRDVQVIGVVQDYQYNVMTDPIEAMVLHYAPEAFRYANVRVRPGGLEAATQHLEAVWEKIDPVHPIDYGRFDIQLSEGPLYRIFKDITRIIGLVALLAVVISCLGLLGMALYSVETRIQEVGLRKVLGASRRSIVLLLSREYVRLIAIAGVMCLPLAWFGSGLWLQAFAHRMALSPWLFAGCTLLMGALALAVITTQTLRAASVDPVKSLRHE